MGGTKPGPNSGCDEEQGNKSGLEQHPVGLVVEKSCAALTKERKQMKHRKSVRRGQTLKTTRSEQMRPAQQTTISMVELLEIHSSVGAYHRRSEWPSD